MSAFVMPPAQDCDIRHERWLRGVILNVRFQQAMDEVTEARPELDLTRLSWNGKVVEA